jgi:hypothetical protein
MDGERRARRRTLVVARSGARLNNRHDRPAVGRPRDPAIRLQLPTLVREGVIGIAVRGWKSAEAPGRGDDLRSASALFSR